MFQRILATSADWAIRIAGLTLGLVMFPHGAQKMLGWYGGGGFAGTVEGFGQMGLPALLSVVVILGEFLGALGLLAGFLSRIAAAGIGVIMLGAMLLAHAGNGFFMNWMGNQGGEGYEYHLLALGLSLVVVLRGAGAASLDRWLSSRAD